MVLDARQNMALQVSERTMSVLSIAGSFFIMGTFARWKYFRKPINRLVFYASFGNVMANVATLISTSALPHAGERSSGLCEFQGFLIQWFMMADSLWVFCMALNVALVFFYGYDSIQLRHLEKWYIMIGYGLPAIPAIVYLILDHHGPKRIIGPATIWCWVSSEVEWLRIAFFYGPVWVVVCSTLCIHIVTGREIFKKRAILRSFSKQTDTDRKPPLTNPFRDIKVETEIKVETHPPVDGDSATPSPNCEIESRSSFSSTKNLSPPIGATSQTAPNQSRLSRMSWGAGSSNKETSKMVRQQNEESRDMDPEAEPIKHHNPNRRRTAAMEGNTAAWGYFKVAFLMFAALFIVWVPSTVNRLQQLIHKDKAIFGLNLASALVLPLQGFWNAMVYLATTWPECRRAISETMDQLSSGTHVQRQQATYRKGSEHTLTTNETQEFGAEIPLGEMLKGYDLRHSRLSSTETMRTPLPHRQMR